METRKHKSELALVSDSMIAFQYQNPILCCRCMKGECKKKGCSRVKTDTNDVLNRTMDRLNNSLPFKSDTVYENRKQILTDHYPSFKFNDNPTLDYQDAFYPITIEAEEREYIFRLLQKNRRAQRLKVKHCRPSKSNRYHKGSSRWKAQQLINQAYED